MDLNCQADEICKQDAGSNYEKTVENENMRIDQTTDSDKASDPEVESNSDGGLNLKEVDDVAAESDLVDEANKQDIKIVSSTYK